MSMLLWPLLALAIGLLLLAAEVVLPTSGLLFFPALAFLTLGLISAFAVSPALGWWILAADGILVPSTLVGSIYLLSRTSLRPDRATLRPPEDSDLDVAHAGRGLAELVGRRGRASTPLRPSGKVDFDGRRLDGVSEGGLIAAGSPILAVGVRSGRVVVRDAEEGPADAPRPAGE